MQRALNRERPRARQRKHVAAGKILEHDVVKRRPREVDRRSVSKSINDVWMSNAIERNGLILEIGNEGAFEFGVGFILEEDVQRLDDDCTRRAVGSRIVVSNVDLCVAPTAKTFDDVVPAIESALLKF